MADVNNNNVGVNRGLDPLLSVRDHLFHALFHKLSLAYADAVGVRMRRAIETSILVAAMACLVSLVYVHIAFARTHIDCLDQVKGDWPRDGVLRVEVHPKTEDGVTYTLEDSYRRESRLYSMRRHGDDDDLYMLLAVLYSDGVVKHEEGQAGSNINEKIDIVENENSVNNVNNVSLLDEEIDIDHWLHVDEDGNHIEVQHLDAEHRLVNESRSEEESHHEDVDDSSAFNREETFYQRASVLDSSILEYSLEYGLLRLSPETRAKLNVSVKLVLLDPDSDACFGDAISKIVLKHFLGYDELLMASIKSLADSENNKGFFRNVLSGAHYQLVSRGASSTSYIVAILVALVFTMSISTLLRYSQHQIFVFIVELLQMFEFNTAVSFPAAPLLTVILALVGMEAIMSEFFEDTTTAFYIILVVWMADQYDAICCHTVVTKRYWLRFFYLYHLTFYCYHYRFSGRYSGLALLTMWLLIQHSMLYFFHHLELPAILSEEDRMRGNPHTDQVRRRPTMLLAVHRHNNVNVRQQQQGGGEQQQQGAQQRVRPMRTAGFSFAGIRFRFGVVLQDGRQRQARNIAANGNSTDNSTTNNNGVANPVQTGTSGSDSGGNSNNANETVNNSTSAMDGSADVQIRESGVVVEEVDRSDLRPETRESDHLQDQEDQRRVEEETMNTSNTIPSPLSSTSAIGSESRRDSQAPKPSSHSMEHPRDARE